MLVLERRAGQQLAQTAVAVQQYAWETKFDLRVRQLERRVGVEHGQGLGEAPCDGELGRSHRRLQRDGVVQAQGASSAAGNARATISSAAVTRLVEW
jgi:hypothetical protein